MVGRFTNRPSACRKRRSVGACCKMNCNTPKKRCHPERLKKIEDFRRESKDLRTDLTANVPSVRRSFDSLRSLRMTDFGCVAKTAFCIAKCTRRQAKTNCFPSGKPQICDLRRAGRCPAPTGVPRNGVLRQWESPDSEESGDYFKSCSTKALRYLPGPAVSAPSPVRPNLWAKSWRILYLRILPAAFMGKESTNSMYRGTLWRAMLALM